MDSVLKKTLLAVAAGQGRITVMTGAGISAESGIPTFRGPEGYWTVGSKEYHPQEMATYSAGGGPPVSPPTGLAERSRKKIPISKFHIRYR